MSDILDRLDRLTKQGEDYIWRPAADAVAEIKRLRSELKEANRLSSELADILQARDEAAAGADL